MTTPTKEQVEIALDRLYNDALSYRDGYGDAHENNEIVTKYISHLEADIDRNDYIIQQLILTLRHYSSMGQFYTNPLSGEREHADIGAPARSILSVISSLAPASTEGGA